MHFLEMVSFWQAIYFLRKENLLSMKRNLVKILALSAVALSMSACGGKKPSNSSASSSQDDGPKVYEVSFAELTTLDGGKWELEGKEVIIKDACIYGVYENGKRLTVAEPYSESGSSGGGAEVELKEAYAFTAPNKGQTGVQHGINGMGAGCDIQGVVADENGHVVIKDAVIENVNERLFDDSGARIPNSGVGLSYSYWRDITNQRAGYNELGRSDSGHCYEQQVTLATLPGTITAEEETRFFVTFPGENPFVEDEYNMDLIGVTVPKGVAADEIEYLNDFFADKEIGDQLTVTTSIIYNDEGTGMELLISGGWTHFADCYVLAEEPVEFISSYEEIADKFDEKYLTGMLPLPESENVYRYDLNDLYYSDISELTGDTSWIDETLAVNGGLIAFEAYAPFGALAGLQEAYETRLGLLGFEDVTGTKTNAKYFRLADADTVYADVMLAQSTNEAETEYCLYFAFVAERVVTSAETDTFAAAVAAINEQVGSGFVSALPALPATPAASEFKASWLNVDMLEGAETYTITPTFADDAFADDDAFDDYIEAYDALLAAAGFVKGYDIPSLQMKELYMNPTTHELAFFDTIVNEDEEIVGLRLYDIVVGDSCSLVFDCTEDHAWTYMEAIQYADQAFASFFGEGTTITDYASAGYQQAQGTFSGLYYATAKAEILAGLSEIIAPSCAQYLGQDVNTTRKEGHTYTDLYWGLNSGDAASVIYLVLEADEFLYGGSVEVVGFGLITYVGAAE